MNSFEIIDIKNEKIPNKISNWPVTYILMDKNKREMYIGETYNLKNRLTSHSKSKERKRLNEKVIVLHNEGNKSAALLIESYLIQAANTDGKWNVINKDMKKNDIYDGHNFYLKNNIDSSIPFIWNQLVKKGIFVRNFNSITNDDLYKYSPYKAFSPEQMYIVDSVVNNIRNSENSYIEGGAGTGKTLLIVKIAIEYIIKNRDGKNIAIYSAKTGNYNIFKRVLDSRSPSERRRIKVVKDIKKSTLDKFDHILIDESQLLKENNYGFSAPEHFSDSNLKDEVEHLKNCGISFSLFYDPNQSFSNKGIRDLQNSIGKNRYKLEAQFRMKVGEEYLTFVKEFLGLIPESDVNFDFTGYNLKIFEDEESLFRETDIQNMTHGELNNRSRMVASLGYAKHSSKNYFNTKNNVKRTDIESCEPEFLFGDTVATWNKVYQPHYNDWLIKSTIKEVGCVHTVAGKDLTYAGVLFADDIYEINGKVKIDYKKYGSNKLSNLTKAEKDKTVKDAYYVLMTRGIFGTGLYFKDKSMQKRMERFLKRVKF